MATTSNKDGCSCRTRIALPVVIPWESGSNKFASQKGSKPFGAYRGNVDLLPPASRAGASAIFSPPQVALPSFSRHRPQITTVTLTKEERIPIDQIVNHRQTEGVLKRWSQPNPHANNSAIDKRRDTRTEARATILRQLSEEEERKCKAAVPRFLEANTSEAAKHEKALKSSPRHRSTWDHDILNSPERQRYLAWSAGQITTIKPVFKIPSPPRNMNYYETLMYEKQFSDKILAEKLARLSEERADSEQISLASDLSEVR